MIESLLLIGQLAPKAAGDISKAAGDISLSWFEVSIAATLLAINSLISMKLRLGLAKQIVSSSVRMTIQLALLGLVLKQIFELSTVAPVLILCGVMTVIAGLSAVRRIDHRYPSIYATAIFSVWAST